MGGARVLSSSCLWWSVSMLVCEPRPCREQSLMHPIGLIETNRAPWCVCGFFWASCCVSVWADSQHMFAVPSHTGSVVLASLVLDNAWFCPIRNVKAVTPRVLV